MTEKNVQTAIKKAIKRVQGENPSLNFQVAHERSIAHRLAVHMEGLFPKWNVDCEYDRDGQLKKRLPGITQCDEEKKTDAIFPDIIVHHRGSKGRNPNRNPNLLVIEMKKGAVEDDCDKRKLELFTRSGGYYHYQLGLYINVAGGKFMCTWYKGGSRCPSSPTFATLDVVFSCSRLCIRGWCTLMDR